jgi:hypothetical protein
MKSIRLYLMVFMCAMGSTLLNAQLMGFTTGSQLEGDAPGSLDTGLSSDTGVDLYSGALVIQRDIVNVPGRGLPLKLRLRFSSDAFYGKNYLGTVPAPTTDVTNQVTLGYAPHGLAVPAEDTTYALCSKGWSYELPRCQSKLILLLPDGRTFDMHGCLSDWKSKSDNSEWDAYTYYHVRKLPGNIINVLIPKAHCSITATVSAGIATNIRLYYSDGSCAVFNSSGLIDELYDPSGYNKLAYYWNQGLKEITHYHCESGGFAADEAIKIPRSRVFMIMHALRSGVS